MNFNEAFLEGISGNEQFAEGVEIMRRNSSGRIWLVGSMVYGTITHQMYGSQMPKVDLDFVVERKADRFSLPAGWSVSENRFGNPKFVKGDESIDCVPIRNIHSIQERGLEPTIENVLSGAPLTVQSIAYDVFAHRVIGEVGMDAINRLVVGVNNLQFAEYRAEMLGITVADYLRDKAQALGFTEE